MCLDVVSIFFSIIPILSQKIPNVYIPPIIPVVSIFFVYRS